MSFKVVCLCLINQGKFVAVALRNLCMLEMKFRLRVRVLWCRTRMFIDPTIAGVHSGFSGYIWLEKSVF